MTIEKEATTMNQTISKAIGTGKKPRHDKIYRLKNLSIREICDKYSDCVSDMWSENGKPVLELEHVRIKYVNTDTALMMNHNIEVEA